jgi:hypothetical protein
MLLRMKTRTVGLSARTAALGGLAAGAALLVLTSLPAAAQTGPAGVSTCPVLDLANPSPGDQVSSGDYVVSGVAFDPVTRSGSDVSHIDFFLGPRDQGGTMVGSAIVGAGANLGPRQFQTTITLPDLNRGETFVAYAYSALSSATTSVSLPIQVGSPPKAQTPAGATPTPVPASVTVKAACPVVSAAPGSGLNLAPAMVPVVNVKQRSGPTIQLANPNAYDVLPRGTYVAFGAAFDPASTDGPGVDRVEYFLGERDAGGLHLGTATPGILNGGGLGAYGVHLHIPTTANGGNNVIAYAHSAITGLESATSVPVYVGAPPSPTPRP